MAELRAKQERGPLCQLPLPLCGPTQGSPVGGPASLPPQASSQQQGGCRAGFWRPFWALAPPPVLLRPAASKRPQASGAFVPEAVDKAVLAWGGRGGSVLFLEHWVSQSVALWQEEPCFSDWTLHVLLPPALPPPAGTDCGQKATQHYSGQGGRAGGRVGGGLSLSLSLSFGGAEQLCHKGF